MTCVIQRSVSTAYGGAFGADGGTAGVGAESGGPERPLNGFRPNGAAIDEMPKAGSQE
ncbi:hypothetical protein [Streptomyces fagopyri]|uniref:hypothetical protein n=1 Tax=Streptomyces fagopyri TaxID=2662397 RepID=UPI0033C57E4A